MHRISVLVWKEERGTQGALGVREASHLGNQQVPEAGEDESLWGEAEGCKRPLVDARS